MENGLAALTLIMGRRQLPLVYNIRWYLWLPLHQMNGNYGTAMKHTVYQFIEYPLDKCVRWMLKRAEIYREILIIDGYPISYHNSLVCGCI